MQAQTIGQRLKNKRVEKNLTVEDVYKSIKIHPRVLTALENDTAEKKLNKFYIKNFLSVYADFLGLDDSEILNEYLNSHRESDRFSRASEQIDALALFKKPKLLAVFVCVLGIFIFGLFPFFKHHKEDTSPLKLQEEYSADKNFPRKTIAKAGFPVINEEQQLKLVVKAKDEVWMQVKSDDKIIFEGNLKKGSVRYWTAGNYFELWVSDGKSLELELNKQFLGSLGAGAVKNIIITRQGMESRSGK